MEDREYKDLSVHEIKNMASAMSGYAELIARGIVKEDKAKEMAEKIYLQGKIMAEYLDKKYLYDLLRDSLYQPKWQMTDCDNILNKILKKNENKDDIIVINQSVVKINADEYLVEKMLEQLLDNGIKYRLDDSLIEVCLKAEEQTMTIEMTNFAGEISDEECQQLQEPYYRKDKNYSRKIGSQGMGLAIVDEIVKLHNGKISYRWKDSVFSVNICLPVLQSE